MEVYVSSISISLFHRALPASPFSFSLSRFLSAYAHVCVYIDVRARENSDDGKAKVIVWRSCEALFLLVFDFCIFYTHRPFTPRPLTFPFQVSRLKKWNTIHYHTASAVSSMGGSAFHIIKEFQRSKDALWGDYSCFKLWTTEWLENVLYGTRDESESRITPVTRFLSVYET